MRIRNTLNKLQQLTTPALTYNVTISREHIAFTRMCVRPTRVCVTWEDCF